jgi:hypothetical protein
MMDYIMGVILIIAPWVLGFADNRPAMMVAVVVGVATIIYSLLTEYELGAIHVIPMGAHLVMDAIAGLLLIFSPWLFGFADRIIWPHVVLGIIELAAVAMTRRRSDLETMQSHPTSHAM